ncbi:MAG TPA: carboxypeptidase-like regulatory domain-containing protein, partial [Mucilaginibacter sp.]|nr:carboxypeptidase-like regulatory domain-containing protein [Mucilaginibacter sp.]
MKLPLLFFFALFTFLLSNFTQAQTTGGKISGTILDDTKKPLDGATVILLVAKDSSVVSNQLANPDGSFAFQNVKDNTYLIKVTYIGYKNYTSSNIAVSGQKAVALPAIIVSSTGKTLSGTGVTAQRSYVQQKIDRTVVNVNALVSNTGANALEVLEKTPGVQ